jgi:hypothetical protein
MKVSLIVGARAAAAGAVYFKISGGAFAGVIPGIIIGFLCTFVGIAVRWILIKIMGATTGDWRDKIFSIVFPFLFSAVGGYVGALIIAGMIAK